MDIDASIFKVYDIRGIYPSSLNEEVAYKVGRAYSEIIKRENPGIKPSIAVGTDMRLSSPELKENLIKGLIDSGVNVTDIGMVSTPTFYFAVAYYNFNGGIQVSASHNPKEYNGFKMVRAKAAPVSSETGINEIRDLVVKGEFPLDVEKGTLSTKEGVVQEEVKAQSRGININAIKPFKIVIDAANSMGSIDMTELFSLLPCNLIKENFELDGNFPVHVADPLDAKNLAFCEEAVKKHGADLGISIDGDGDRYFFVDEKGVAIPQPIIRGIMAQVALKENPGATVAYDIRPGRITKDMIDEVGGKSIITKVGHSLIKQQMLANNAVFGGESSGHYFYKLPYGTFESPVSLVLRLLIYLSEKGKPVSEIVAPYKKYFHTGEVNFEIEDKLGAIKLIEEHFKDGRIINLDGLSIEYPDFWFNIRPSNTEPLLRFALEAVSKEKMEEKKTEVIQLIEEYKNKQ